MYFPSHNAKWQSSHLLTTIRTMTLPTAMQIVNEKIRTPLILKNFLSGKMKTLSFVENSSVITVLTPTALVVQVSVLHHS